MRATRMNNALVRELVARPHAWRERIFAVDLARSRLKFTRGLVGRRGAASVETVRGRTGMASAFARTSRGYAVRASSARGTFLVIAVRR